MLYTIKSILGRIWLINIISNIFVTLPIQWGCCRILIGILLVWFYNTNGFQKLIKYAKYQK